MLVQLLLQGTTVELRRAAAQDVASIVDLLAADQLGATRDGVTSDAELQPHRCAFDAIDSDPAHLLLVATDDAASRPSRTVWISFACGNMRRRVCASLTL